MIGGELSGINCLGRIVQAASCLTFFEVLSEAARRLASRVIAVCEERVL